ncbi:hypothetical protein [Catellatospora chokoriensis]|uniref:Uncharacterized protein n=1 Tax=Catellatospora chokoriensis TaxID=310353 RepID=A0A8J3NTW1_9ACTN|nr:hypothetical protein [Catellatospora chokoriensis]GIF92141.1 hypothetical protein Cch02nite_55850 [Catellatospora chokoriensis]
MVLAGCLAVGYALSLLDGVVRAARTMSYQPTGWYWPVLVGLGIAAAGMLGRWLGRVLSSRLTAPLPALGALVMVVVSQVLWHDRGPALTDLFLLLSEDWFSSPGFEWHPHRGLETVTTARRRSRTRRQRGNVDVRSVSPSSWADRS